MLEDRLRKAEDRAQKAESELAKVVGMWGQLKVYLDAMEVRSRDARVGFDRIIEGVGIATGLGFADFGDVEQHSPVYAPAHTTGKHPRDSEFDALQEPNAPTAPPPKKRRRKTAQNESTPTAAPAQAPKAVPLSASSSAISVDVEEMLLNATSHEDKRQKRRASSVSSSFSSTSDMLFFVAPFLLRCNSSTAKPLPPYAVYPSRDRVCVSYSQC